MGPSLDIFKIESSSVLWRDTVATVETAKARIQKLALFSPGDYLILDQQTGRHISVIPLAASEQNEHPSVESDHYGPRVGCEISNRPDS